MPPTTTDVDPKTDSAADGKYSTVGRLRAPSPNKFPNLSGTTDPFRNRLPPRNTVDHSVGRLYHEEPDSSAERVQDSEGRIVNGVEYVY